METSKIENLKAAIQKNRLAYSLLYPAVLLRRWVVGYKARHYETFYDSMFELVEGGHLLVRVPGFRGTFEIDFRSQILMRILRDRKYEPELVKVAEKYIDPQRDVLDIGANIGLFTILFSKIVSSSSRVLAVEPTPSALGYLRRNIERNCDPQSVIVVEGVATNKQGPVRLNTIPGMEEYSSLGDVVHPSVQGRSTMSIEVNGHTIDSLVNEFGLDPGFIKVDTEGAEYLVISGAINTLIRHRPVILSELSDTLLSSFGDTSAKVIDLLENNGYKVVDADAPDVPIEHPFIGDILAFPEANENTQ
jgi:FkbM family methyltransferase